MIQQGIINQPPLSPSFARQPKDVYGVGEVSFTPLVLGVNPTYQWYEKIDADCLDYINRVEALQGYAVNPFIKLCLHKFFRSLKVSGAWTSIAELYLMMGVDFAGLRAKAKYLVTDSMIPVGFTDSDYVPLGPSPGLENVGTHYMDTDLSSSGILGDPDVMPGIGALMVCDLPPSGTGLIIGNNAVSGGSAFGYHTVPSGIRFRFQSNSSITGPNPSEQCNTAFLTSASTAGRVLGDQELGPYAYTKGTGVSPSTIKLFNVSSQDFPFVGRMMAAWVLQDATPQQILDIHAAIDSLKQDLNPFTIIQPSDLTIQEGEDIIFTVGIE